MLAYISIFCNNKYIIHFFYKKEAVYRFILYFCTRYYELIDLTYLFINNLYVYTLNNLCK